jgi:hypothetical protein
VAQIKVEQLTLLARRVSCSSHVHWFVRLASCASLDNNDMVSGSATLCLCFEKYLLSWQRYFDQHIKYLGLLRQYMSMELIKTRPGQIYHGIDDDNSISTGSCSDWFWSEPLRQTKSARLGNAIWKHGSLMIIPFRPVLVRAFAANKKCVVGKCNSEARVIDDNSISTGFGPSLCGKQKVRGWEMQFGSTGH